MGKIRVTKKQIRENFSNIICVGYCDLQHLLNYRDVDFYSTRVEGWACDYYKINNNTIISTGYAPIGNIRNYDINRKYDDKAREILENHKIDYNNFDKSFDNLKQKLEKLLEKYVKEMLVKG